MRNIKLTIEYEGTNYSGWQRQKNSKTIQQLVEESIQVIAGSPIQVIGCSRTDAGVHAKGFVGNFNTDCSIPEEKFKDAMNSKLPEDIVILNSEEVSEGFHSRYSAIGKVYSYTILNRTVPSAIDRNLVYHYKRPLDYDAMQCACDYYLGEHDFSAFRSTGSSVKTSIRNIKKAYFQRNGERLIFTTEGDGFLYNMVRIMVGTLIEVGIGKLKPEDILDIINSKDRSMAGNTAPASGLCLEAVYY